MLTIFIIFGSAAAEKICKQTYSFIIISSLCMNITEQKNKRYSVCFQSCQVRLAIMPVSCSFYKKFVQSVVCRSSPVEWNAALAAASAQERLLILN